MVPVQYHRRKSAAGPVRDRGWAGADGDWSPQQGRVPDSEGGGLGHLQPDHQWKQDTGGAPGHPGRHPALLQVSHLNYRATKHILMITFSVC